MTNRQVHFQHTCESIIAIGTNDHFGP